MQANSNFNVTLEAYSSRHSNELRNPSLSLGPTVSTRLAHTNLALADTLGHPKYLITSPERGTHSTVGYFGF